MHTYLFTFSRHKMKRTSEFHCPECYGTISVTRLSLSMYLQHTIYLYVHAFTISHELIYIYINICKHVKISQDVYIYVYIYDVCEDT